MGKIALLADAEIKFDIEINGCFGGSITELHLIPSESESSGLFFQVNQSCRKSFVVKVSKQKAEKLISHLLDYSTAEEIMPKDRSTTSIEGKITWKNISYPELDEEGKIRFPGKSYIKPDEYRDVLSFKNLSDEKKNEIQAFIDKGIFSPLIAIAQTLEKLSKNEEEFIKFVDTL